MFYEFDTEIQDIMEDLIKKLELNYINTKNVFCLRSYGSKSKKIVARIHSLSKIMQFAMKTKPFYVIELVSENFDKLSYEEKIKTIIHEILHIPKSFAGGFRNHKPYVTKKIVEATFKKYITQ